MGAAWKHYDSFLGFLNDDVILTLVASENCIDLITSSRSSPHPYACSETQSSIDGLPGTPSSFSELPVSGWNPVLDSQSSDATPIYLGNMHVKIRSWNVRGAIDVLKHDCIDTHLSTFRYGVIGMQESKLTTGTCISKHYKLILRSPEGSVRVYRGVAILVHLSCLHLIKRVYTISSNIMSCDFLLNDHLVNVHIPQDDDGAIEFGNPKDFVVRRNTSQMIILGDFNAHIAKLDRTAGDKMLVGPNLFHDLCHANGYELKYSFR